MSIVDVLRHALDEHALRASREGRALEANFVALIRELVMTTMNEIQGKVNGLSDKMSQLEADVTDLVAKQGGTAGGATSDLTVTQEQLDSVGAAVDSVGSRIDALKEQVVNGTPSAAPASTPPIVTPETVAPPVSPAAPAPTAAPSV